MVEKPEDKTVEMQDLLDILELTIEQYADELEAALRDNPEAAAAFVTEVLNSAKTFLKRLF